MDFWQVRFQTIDTAPDMSAEDFMEIMKININKVINPLKQGEPLISNWIATVRMRFNFSKYENNSAKDESKNIYSYQGNNIKTRR